MRRIVALALALSLSLQSPLLLAQGAGAEARADAIWKQAEQLAGEGKYHEAIPLYEESLRFKRSLGRRHRLAGICEQAGKTARAFALYVDLAEQARASGKAALEKDARYRAAELATIVPNLILDVPLAARDIRGLVVAIDGAAVAPSDFGKPLSVDPGEHSVTAAAPGKKPMPPRGVSAAPGTRTVVLIPPLEDAPLPPLVIAPATPLPAALPPMVPSTRPRAVASLTLVAVALAGAGAGTALGVLAMNQDAAWKRETGLHCDGRGDCDTPTSVALIQGIESDRGRLGAASTVSFLVAGAALASSAIVWLTRPGRPGTRVAIEIVPAPAASLRGTF